MQFLRSVLNYFAPKAEAAPDNIIALGVSGTSQKSLTTEQPSWFNANQQFLIPRHNLNDYWNLFQQSDLAHAIVNCLAHGIVSELKCVSESDELATWINEWIERTNLQTTVLQMVKNMLLFGVSYGEICTNGSRLFDGTQIEKIKIVDSRSVVQQVTKHGDVKLFVQKPLFMMNPNVLNVSFDTPLVPQSILCFRNNSETVFSRYGLSVLEPIRSMLIARQSVIDASVAATVSSAKPLVFFAFTSDAPMDQRNRVENIKSMREETDKAEKLQTRFLMAAGGQGQYQLQPISATLPTNIQDVVNQLSVACSIACGIAPSQLGLSTTGSGTVTSFESSSSNSLNQHASLQTMVLEQLKPLWDLLPFIEKVPSGEIKVTMESVSVEVDKQIEETSTIRINNTLLQAKAGLIGPDAVMRNLGLGSKVFDEDLFNTHITGPPEPTNGNDPNVNQQQRASIQGKTGNNPSGTKGEET